MNFDLRISILFAKAKDKDIMKEFPLSLSRQKSFCLRQISIWLTALLLPTPLLAHNDKTKDTDTYKEIKELEQCLEKTATKMLRLANKVAAGIGSEIREYRKDIIECCPEVLVVRDSLKAQAKRGLEHCRREMHRGFRQGLRGEPYDPDKE
jgi:hypothetical protein